MAVGWISLLKTVPWANVIASAPAVADGAKKLWNAVAKKPPINETPTEHTPASHSPQAQSIAQLQDQVAALESTVADQHRQLLDSSELIKALAEQNEQLVKRVEANRVRLTWVSVASVVALAVAVASAAGLFAP